MVVRRLRRIVPVTNVTPEQFRAVSILCHATVYIPMRPGTDSLNVAVATGLLLYRAAASANAQAQR